MARLRPVNVINLLSFEEKTRFTNFFMLLVEIDARLPKTTQTKARQRTKLKIQQIPIEQKRADIRYTSNTTSRLYRSSRTAQQNLCLYDNLFISMQGLDQFKIIFKPLHNQF